MQIMKVVEDGRVYAHTDYGNGTLVVEKADPVVTHDAPAIVDAGTSLTVTFTMFDFDGERRLDSGGELHLDIDGTALSLPVTEGQASLALEVHASVTIRQEPPFFIDARMVAFTIEVTP